jgi:hypothetical protein
MSMPRRSSIGCALMAYPASDADAAALAALDASAAADRAALDSWALDAGEVSDAELQTLCASMFHARGLLGTFCISPTALAAFIADVAAGYNDANAFHNWRHAFQVTHQCYLFLTDAALGSQLLGELECLALLLAALCHDLDHPGTTNAYQANSCSALAVRYNDSASTLEQHHAAEGFQALERAGLLEALPPAQRKRFRALFLAAVLGTDMGRHKDLLARASDRAPAWAALVARGVRCRTAPDDAELLCAFLLHSADLCNPLLPPATSQRIVRQLSHEFALQAELERDAQLPVTVPLAHDAASTASMELGFLEFGALHVARARGCSNMPDVYLLATAVVCPLYATLTVFAPVVGPQCSTLIEANRTLWRSMAQEAA